MLAGGYGACRSVGGSPFPKVVEDIDGLPMICRVAGLIPETKFSPRVVVVNPIYEELIETALRDAGLNDCRFVVQPRRSGAGEAVRLAVPCLQEGGADEFLTIYGDMPLWRPETVDRLVAMHRNDGAVLSMVTVERNSEYPAFDHYGRIIRDQGDISRVVEPADANVEEREISTVNPSLWVWNLAWFAEHIGNIPFYQSKDGLGKERFLPPLVEIAHQEGRRIAELRIEDPTEALGVNTEAELERVRQIFQQRACFHP